MSDPIRSLVNGHEHSRDPMHVIKAKKLSIRGRVRLEDTPMGRELVEHERRRDEARARWAPGWEG